MDENTAATITATIISTIIASLIAIVVNYISRRNSSKLELEKELHQIIKYSFDYPYLENEAFISKWNQNKNSDEERYLRYDIFCNLIFNYLEKLAKFHNYESKKIQNDVNARDWVRAHKDAWLNPVSTFENADGYCDKFKSLMNSYLT